ncbi:TniQ family protein [Actinacidiphila polyblastidii]|uniref:TniQ family protein n=1 Tax=Actinacidiphila polyblastidii TaxID=3110430 RepID=UPI0039BD7D57
MIDRPLPRSLDPLYDETLVGFVLRLACHNGTVPAEIAARMGLTDETSATPGFVPSWQLADMDKPSLVRAARVAQLTVAEADQLLLAPLGHRYGLVSRRYRPWTDPQQLSRPDRWIFIRASQYCPPCLKGDSDLLGQLYGGAWKRAWRLPVMFACSRHQQLLGRYCPKCRTPGQFSSNGLITRAGAGELHPTQCRGTASDASSGGRRAVCGANLARAHSPRMPADSDTQGFLLALQQRLDALLSDDGPQVANSCGTSIPVAQYFVDLRVVATLVMASWPEAIGFAATPALAKAIEREVEQRRRSRRRAPGGTKRYYGANSSLSPTESSLAMGAVLGIAERILDGREKQWTEMAVGPLYRGPLRAGTFPELVRQSGTSSALQEILGVVPRAEDVQSSDTYDRSPRNG